MSHTPMQIAPDIVVGRPNARAYLDATGRCLNEGDFITYVTRSGSSVYVNYGKIKQIIDLDHAVYIGYGERADNASAAPRVMSWDYAYKLKIIPYEYDRVRTRWTLPTKWEKNPLTGVYGHVEQAESDVKVRTINAVERVIRLDFLDVV